MTSKRKIGLAPIVEVNKSQPNLDVNVQLARRAAYDQETFDRIHGYHSEGRNYFSKLIHQPWSCYYIFSFFCDLFPIFRWLRLYSLRRHLPHDIVAGITVGVFHIPQGMAYAMLAEVPPVYGLYVSIFPAFIYVIFGTSFYVSVGTFAIICLMLNKVIVMHTSESLEGDDLEKEKIDIAVAACFATGVLQISMAFFRLGALGSFFSEALISGFTTGAAVHVMTSQIKYLFGIILNVHEKYFSVIYVYSGILAQIKQTNLITLVISAITIIILLTCQNLLQTQLNKKLQITIPFDLMIIIIGTTFSHFGHLKDKYGVHVVGHIPTGLPAPKVPDMNLVKAVILDCIPLAVISFAVGYSMGIMLAKNHKNQVRSNKELLAFGLCNLGSSFFWCFPCAVSLSRSAIQEKSGAKSQVCSVVSSLLVLVVVISIAPLFEELPVCVLACVIITALQKMLFNITKSSYYCRISSLEGSIWLITFVTVVIADVDIGLLVGIAFSIVSAVCRTLHCKFCGVVMPFGPYACLYGNILGTNIYVDLNRYNKAKELKGFVIYHFSGPLFFGNCGYYREKLFELSNINPIYKELPDNKTPIKRNLDGVQLTTSAEVARIPRYYSTLQGHTQSKKKYPRSVRFIILDFSAVTQLDYTAYNSLLQIMEDYFDIGIMVLFASCSHVTLDFFRKAGLYETPLKQCIFPSIHDAVLYGRSGSPYRWRKISTELKRKIESD